MQVISNIALISINETLVVQLISFLIFLFIINRLMFRPLRKVMNDRDTYLEEIRQGIVQSEQDLINYTNQIEEKKEAIRTEAFDSIKEMDRDGRHQAEGIIAVAEEEISGLRKKAMQEIDTQISVAKQETEKEAAYLAVGIMEKVLERRLAS